MFPSAKPWFTIADIRAVTENSVLLETYIKLLIAHLVVLFAYGNLRRLRRQRHTIHIWYLYAKYPLAGLSLLLVPLTVVLVQMVLTRCDSNALHKSMTILLGRVPSDASLRALATNKLRHSREWRQQLGNKGRKILDHFPKNTNTVAKAMEDTSTPSPELSWDLLGVFVLLIAVLSQSIGSFCSSTAKASGGSDAFYDYKILQLALLGLSVSVATILQLSLRPRYAPRGMTKDPKTDWVHFLRPDLLLWNDIISMNMEGVLWDEIEAKMKGNETEVRSEETPMPHFIGMNAEIMTFGVRLLETVLEGTYIYFFLIARRLLLRQLRRR